VPNKDLEKRREYQATYCRERNKRLRANIPPGICSHYPGCHNQTDGSHKQCAFHIAYMLEYKRKYRKEQVKAPGQCSSTDCKNPARPGFKLCERCNLRACAAQKLPHAKERGKERNQEIQEEVFSAYGGKCTCCGEAGTAFLSIDHIDGYNGNSPRKGANLYRWLKRNNFPTGFRVLCMSCNFALGHHGYCPHSDLTCETRIGRPVTKGTLTPDQTVRRKNYWVKRKLEVFNAYNGPICTCCGETNLECLSIDHINNDGAKHRKEINGDPRDNRNLYIWLRNHGFPPGFQVLCMNCNFAKGHFGECPHIQEHLKEVS
jgi:hypothetical protein